MSYTKQPLYRKVNTRARNVHHALGGDFKAERQRSKASDERCSGMHAGRQRGLDYTPLFKFLLSRVGQNWDSVFSEAVSRLDRQEPIFWLVAKRQQDRQDWVRVGETSYYSGLYVDEDNVLKLVNPELTVDQMVPSCGCCTHTLNGVRFTQSFD